MSIDFTELTTLFNAVRILGKILHGGTQSYNLSN